MTVVVPKRPKARGRIFPIHKKGPFVTFCIIMAVVLFVSIVLGMRLGAADADYATIGKIIVNKITGQTVFLPTWRDATETIIWNIRFPRVMTALVVGAGLTVAGILMQVLTKNPLADPYVLGISQGASSGAVAVIMYGFLGFLGGYATMAGAFIGALVSIALALRIATIRKTVTATQLVLAGIAVSALFGAITNLMIYHTAVGTDKVKTATQWMLGSLAGSSWEKLIYAATALIACLIVIMILTRKLDVLMLGDDVASTVGVDTRKLKLGIILLATLLTGVIVSISGTIGFVGLTIPHITRQLVGTSHRRLVPASILVGGTFLVVADILCRVLAAPEELPIGVMSAFVGAPFFLYLIRRANKKTEG